MYIYHIYVCMYIHTHIHIHMYKYTYIHTYICTYISISCIGIARSRSVSALFTVFALTAFLLLLHILFLHLLLPPLISFPHLYSLPLLPSSVARDVSES